VLDLLGGGVDLLLALLATTTEAEDEVKSALLLDVVVGEGTAILELLASEDQALLVWGNTLLVCDGAMLVFLRVNGDLVVAGAVCGDGDGHGGGKMRTLDLGLDIVDGVG